MALKKKSNIDIPRLYKLLSKEVLPTSLGDEVFLNAYKGAMDGNLLTTTLLEMSDTLDNLSVDEVFLLMVGYGIGQQRLEEKDLEIQRKMQNNKLKLN